MGRLAARKIITRSNPDVEPLQRVFDPESLIKTANKLKRLVPFSIYQTSSFPLEGATFIDDISEHGDQNFDLIFLGLSPSRASPRQFLTHLRLIFHAHCGYLRPRPSSKKAPLPPLFNLVYHLPIPQTPWHLPSQLLPLHSVLLSAQSQVLQSTDLGW